jgi:ribosome-binding protein aMBF1 (putative translation factor)
VRARDRLAEKGPLLDEPHTKQLDGKLRELRFHLGNRPTRITCWIAPGRRIILLTVFAKTSRSDARSSGPGRPWSVASPSTSQRTTMSDRTRWNDLKKPRSAAAQRAYEDEARISDFRELVYRLRTDAGLTQAELAERMSTTQSAIARMEGGRTRPNLETLEKLAAAVGQELIVGVGEHLSENRSIAKLVRDGHAVVRRAG